MDVAKLNDWMQVLGIFAVVASLIFVGLQMKQEHAIAQAGQFQERSAIAVEFWNGTADSEFELERLGNIYAADPAWADTFAGMDNVTEIGSSYVSARRIFVVMDNHHFQYIHGFHDEDAWQMFRGMLSNYLRQNSVARAMIRNQPNIFRPSFYELCLQVLAELESVEQVATDVIDTDIRQFVANYLAARTATQQPDATSEDLEHYLSFLVEDVGYQHLPYNNDDTRYPAGKSDMREGMTHYLGMNAAYSAELVNFTHDINIVTIQYQGVHEYQREGEPLTVENYSALDVLELEDGKVTVIREYRE